jgi:hypothetical protein
MYEFYCAYAYVDYRDDGAVCVHVMSAAPGFPDNALARAARTLAVSGRPGRAYWVIHQPGVDPKLWIRPYKPRPSKPRRFYTDPGTGRILDES